MNDFYTPLSGVKPLPQQAAVSKNYDAWITVLKVFIGVCIFALAVFVYLYLAQPSTGAEVQNAVSSVSKPTMQLDDKVFTYDGEIVLDGKAHNVSIRIDGITTEDAVKIVKAYVGA